MRLLIVDTIDSNLVNYAIHNPIRDLKFERRFDTTLVRQRHSTVSPSAIYQLSTSTMPPIPTASPSVLGSKPFPLPIGQARASDDEEASADDLGILQLRVPSSDRDHAALSDGIYLPYLRSD